jgi:hypothetical protein
MIRNTPDHRSRSKREGRKERSEANCFLTEQKIQIASLLTIFKIKVATLWFQV